MPRDELETAITQLEEQILQRVPIDEVMFADLGKTRAEDVRQRLLGNGELDPARVFIISGGEAANDNGAVRMDLSLR